MNRLQTIKTVALAAGIVIVFNAFVNMGVKTFYPRPEWNDPEFCGAVEGQTYETQEACEAVGGKWYESGEAAIKPSVRPPPAYYSEEPRSWCDAYFTCQKTFETARELYDRNVFIILVAAGLVALGAGWAISGSPAVSAGFVFGGVVSFIIGTARYWSAMDDYLRFIILGVALAILVWLGYRKIANRV